MTVTEFGRISLLGITSYLLGDVCLPPFEIGDKGAKKGKPCQFQVPNWVKKAIRSIEERKKKIQKILDSKNDEDKIVLGVKLAVLNSKEVYEGAEWDARCEEIEGRYGEQVANAFKQCYHFDLDKAKAIRKKATIKMLVDSIKGRLQAHMEQLEKDLQLWKGFIAEKRSHCGKPHSPCECFRLVFVADNKWPKFKVLEEFEKEFGRLSLHALTPGEPLSEPFLKKISRVKKPPTKGPIKVSMGGWIAAKAEKKNGLHWYNVDGKRYNCCWVEHEMGAFVQIIVVWPGEDKEEKIKKLKPPSETPFGWVRKGWLAGMVEMQVYHTYSWTPTGYNVRLYNFAATSGVGKPAGITLKARREGWVLWRIPKGKKGKAKLLLVVNGKICQEIDIEIE